MIITVITQFQISSVSQFILRLSQFQLTKSHPDFLYCVTHTEEAQLQIGASWGSLGEKGRTNLKNVFNDEYYGNELNLLEINCFIITWIFQNSNSFFEKQFSELWLISSKSANMYEKYVGDYILGCSKYLVWKW